MVSHSNIRSNVIITGGSGFVGRLLQRGLSDLGHRIAVFDKFRGPLINLLRGRPFGTSEGVGVTAAVLVRRASSLTEKFLRTAGVIRPSGDDILDLRERLAERFRGCDAVIHLAALPHPNVPGATEADFRRINYEGSVNVFEAARQAGVPKFILASSAQVYGINKPVRLDQFPILESNYCPSLAEGQTAYGYYKAEFERYLERRCESNGKTQALSLRLEFPGARSIYPWNFYISTSVENTIHGFDCALKANQGAAYDVFNLADRTVDESIVNVQQFIKTEWTKVPNFTTGNDCLLSTEKATRLLGYQPKPDGTYFSFRVMW